MKKQSQIYFFLPNFAIGGAGNSIFNICKVIKREDIYIMTSNTQLPNQ